MDPYRAHDDIGLGRGAVREGLGDCPDMVGEDRGAVGDIGGEEERNRIQENGGDGGRDEEGRDDVSSSIATVARKGATKGMRLGEDWCFGGSIGNGAELVCGMCV